MSNKPQETDNLYSVLQASKPKLDHPKRGRSNLLSNKVVFTTRPLHTHHMYAYKADLFFTSHVYHNCLIYLRLTSARKKLPSKISSTSVLSRTCLKITATIILRLAVRDTKPAKRSDIN